MKSAAGAGDGEALLLSLPDDVLSLLSSLLSPRDLVSLSLSSRSLSLLLLSSDSLWLSQCLRLSLPFLLPPSSLPLWRSGVVSYLSLARFLHSVRPLLGLWVHQNPELGNLVSVLPGPFLSLLALRVLPQELSPSLLFAPVFEILSLPDGSPSLFLHAHRDLLLPASLPLPHPLSNLLLLEAHLHPPPPPPSPFSFPRLSFRDRRRLLDLLASRLRSKIPSHLAAAPLFDPPESLLADRRSALIQIATPSAARIDCSSSAADLSSDRLTAAASRNNNTAAGGKKRSFFSAVRQLIGMSKNVGSLSSDNAASPTEGKHLPLHEFLNAGNTVGLSLRATNARLSTYRAWPNMHDNKFALYKLSVQEPAERKEYAGLWGGTFGWPPGKTSEDKPGKALFFLLLSYEEVDGQVLLIATKILEGTHYVLHPNGSAMFIVKVDEPALEEFPWEFDGENGRVEVKRRCGGEGIANGYGFRYPGSKPGSLFEIQNGMLAFVWKESKAVLTLERLNLEEMLRKGERVPALPPIANFTYLTKSYSNVFAGFPGSSSCSPSPR